MNGSEVLMPMTANSSIIAEALAKVLDAFSPGLFTRELPQNDCEGLILSYSNPDHFDFLWRLWRTNDEEDNYPTEGSVPDGEIITWTQSESEGHKRKDLIIVWDGSPGPTLVGNVRLANYVTPYDWMVAFLLALKSNGLQPNPRLRIRIIDLTSYQSVGGESRRLFHQLYLGRKSGIDFQVSSPTTNADGDTTISQILFEILTAGEVKGTTSSGSFADWRLLKRLWGARLFAPSDARDRHAIANLVGPQLLISSMVSRTARLSSDSPCVIALITLMRVLGLFPSNHEYVSSPWVDPAKFKNYESGTASAPAFVLIDDMYNLGWAEFLRLALGITSGEERETFIASDSPLRKEFGPQGVSSLFDLLQEAGQLRVNSGMELVPGRDVVLFLDLRLFSERTSFEEAEFIKSLLVLAGQARENGARKDLPWIGFSDHEIQAVENFLASGKVDGDDYLVALTLLPRLVALVDPKLPIVLFSSTGQRRVAEALREYQSIITQFDKPRFFADASGEIVEETRDRFEMAMARALSFLKGRAACRRLSQGGVLANLSGKERYVEIYFDESGTVADPTFRVGGVVVFADEERQVTQLNEEMVKQGLTWGSTETEPRPISLLPKDKWPWVDFETKIFSCVDRLCMASQLEPAIAFSLTVSPSLAWSDSTDLTSPACLDNLYRSLLLQALETLFFEVLPARMEQPTPNFRCAVFVAIRERYESIADAHSDWDRRSRLSLESRYGVQIQKYRGQRFFRSIAADGVYPMVSQVRALMPEANIKVVTARGNRLFYQVAERDPDLPRPAHLLADLAVRFSINQGALRVQPSLQQWFDQGFRSTSDEQFASTLQACRYARAGRHVEAVLEAYKASAQSQNGSPLEWWAKPRIARSVSSLSGKDFTELCSRLLA
jgi:hypothetical protein